MMKQWNNDDIYDDLSSISCVIWHLIMDDSCNKKKIAPIYRELFFAIMLLHTKFNFIDTFRLHNNNTCVHGLDTEETKSSIASCMRAHRPKPPSWRPVSKDVGWLRQNAGLTSDRTQTETKPSTTSLLPLPTRSDQTDRRIQKKSLYSLQLQQNARKEKYLF